MPALTQRSRSLSLPQLCPPADANSHNLRVGLAIGAGGSFQKDTAMLTSDPVLKVCRDCRQSKPISDYYRQQQMADGHLNSCKACVCLRVKARYSSEFEKVQQYEKHRHATPERKVKLALYQKNRRAKFPEKIKARERLNNAIRDGRITRQPCEVCGTTNRVQGHHTDYQKWNVVRWLCFEHHRKIGHGQLKHSP